MAIYALIPVFNRLPMTRTIVGQLRSQILDEKLIITVIDDGSTDGTAEFLRSQSDIQTITGNGNLWWGGAICLGLRQTLPSTKDHDWVMFINNDTEIRPDFAQRLLDTARLYAPAAVGSVVCNISPPHRLISVGPRIDPWRFVVEDIGDRHQSVDGVVAVDALSGRGVIYPVAALKAVGGMRSRWLPHYLADYELSLRVHAHGYNLLVTKDAIVYSINEFGANYCAKNIRDRLFSVRSPTYLLAQVAFWWQANGLTGRLFLPFRLCWYFLMRQIFPR